MYSHFHHKKQFIVVSVQRENYSKKFPSAADEMPSQNEMFSNFEELNSKDISILTVLHIGLKGSSNAISKQHRFYSTKFNNLHTRIYGNKRLRYFNFLKIYTENHDDIDFPINCINSSHITQNTMRK